MSTDECNEDVSFNCKNLLGDIRKDYAVYQDNTQEAYNPPIPKEEPEVTFTLAQVQALMASGIAIPQPTPKVDAPVEPVQEAPKSSLEEEAPSVTLFEEELYQFMYPATSALLVRNAGRYAVIAIKKLYILPPIKNLNAFTEIRFERNFKEVYELHLIEYKPLGIGLSSLEPDALTEDLLVNIDPNNHHVVSRRASLKHLFNELLEEQGDS